MVCRICPVKKHCWDKGNCENCDWGKVYEKLNNKIKKLKRNNQALLNENEVLRGQIKTSSCSPEQKKMIRISGECLEGIGINAPRFAIRDKSLDIQVGDIVHCSRDVRFINTYIKQVLSYDAENGKYTVGTHYKDPSRDFTFVADEIYGVITEIYNGDGFLVYEKEGKK